jgi:hypothetical protein
MIAVISQVRGTCVTVYCIPWLKYTSHHKQLLHDELRALKPAGTRDLADSQINKRTTKWGPNVHQSKVGNKYEKKANRSGKHYKDSNNRNNR